MDTPANWIICARICHEVNRAYCESLGDMSQPRWEDAPGWQTDSAVHGVAALVGNPKMTPADSHANWMALKRETGWKYGTVKDADKKLHSCMVPYDQLPPEQQTKDALFHAVVRSFFNLPQAH